MIRAILYGSEQTVLLRIRIPCLLFQNFFNLPFALQRIKIKINRNITSLGVNGRTRLNRYKEISLMDLKLMHLADDRDQSPVSVK